MPIIYNRLNKCRISIIVLLMFCSVNITRAEQVLSRSEKNSLIEYCLIHDEIDSLLFYFNNEEEVVIKALCDYNANIRLGADAFWYCKSHIGSSQLIYKGAHCSYRGESIRLKAIYWIILLYHKMDFHPLKVCEFYDVKQSRILDISILFTVGDSKISCEIEQCRYIEKKITKWRKLLRKQGLESLRRNNVFFMEPAEYNILYPQWVIRGNDIIELNNAFSKSR